jgi:hypothetical protein
MILEQVRQALQFGKQQIEKYGWCQGTLHNGKGEICAKNALYNGIHSLNIEVIHKEHWEIYYAARKYLLRDVDVSKLPEGYDYVVLWNDTKGRTKEEVLAQFDHAIALTTKDLRPSYFAWLA